MSAAAATLALLLLAAPGAPQATVPSSRPAAPRPPDLKAIAALIEKGDTAAAERQLQRIIASSGDPAARQILARLRFEQKRDAEAIVELRKAAPRGRCRATSGCGWRPPRSRTATRRSPSSSCAPSPSATGPCRP